MFGEHIQGQKSDTKTRKKIACFDVARPRLMRRQHDTDNRWSVVIRLRRRRSLRHLASSVAVPLTTQTTN